MKNNSKKYLFILLGPSGVGKTTILRYLERSIGAESSPKFTTRPCRFTKEDEHDFIFCKPEEFPNNGVLKFISYGYLFGIQLEKIDSSLKRGLSHVIIVGHSTEVLQLSSLYKDYVVPIFVYCNSSTLKKRILNDISSQRENRWPVVCKEIYKIFDELCCIDYVINNSYSKTFTYKQVDKLLSRL